MSKFRCLELYSGIGGMHIAFKECGLPFEIIAAIDINPVANSIYARNFPDTKVINKCLTTLSADELSRFDVNVVLMSPPCQPFTSTGKYLDMADERTQSFLHFLELLPRCAKIPSYLFVENVKGFECSETHSTMLSTLSDLEYQWQEFMLSPCQFGIPNSRLRYYLMATRKPLSFGFDTLSEIWTEVPQCKNQKSTGETAEASCSLCNLWSSETPSLRDYLDSTLDADNVQMYMVPESMFKRVWQMDIVTAVSNLSCCFTKRYGRYIEGSGSVIQMSISTEPLSRDVESEKFVADVKSLNLRFFTPREIANLLGFPSDFAFPSELTTQQLYRVLGNSLNVKVVAVLLHLMFAGNQ